MVKRRLMWEACLSSGAMAKVVKSRLMLDDYHSYVQAQAAAKGNVRVHGPTNTRICMDIHGHKGAQYLRCHLWPWRCPRAAAGAMLIWEALAPT